MSVDETTNIILVGVGGQGVLLTAKIIGEAAIRSGLDCYQSEIHGMAQRGGVVETTIRIGKKVDSGLVPKGSADALVGFEPLETYRALKYTNEGSIIISNRSPIYPFTVSLGQQEYPDLEKMIGEIRSKAPKTHMIDAIELAKSAGAKVTANIVMVGAVAASGLLDVSKEEMLKAVLNNVPKKFLELNEKAFELGYQSIQA